MRCNGKKLSNAGQERVNRRVKIEREESHAYSHLVIFGSCPPPLIAEPETCMDNPGLSLIFLLHVSQVEDHPFFQPTGGGRSGAKEDDSKKVVGLFQYILLTEKNYILSATSFQRSVHTALQC
jgi:hypothetical protein